MEQVVALSQAVVFAFILVFFRVAAMMAVLPLFGERIVPIRLRLGLALAFSLLFFGTGVMPVIEMPGLMRAAALLGSEVLAGLVMGLLARFLFMGLQVVGALAAQATSLAQIFAGQTLDPMPALGHVLIFAGLAFLASQGYTVLILEYGIAFYELVPVGQPLYPALLADWGIDQIGAGFGLAFRLAAPFLLASVLYYLAMGAINRAIPQLMVALIGAPLVTFLSMTIFAICAPFIILLWFEQFSAFLLAPGGFGHD